MPNLSNHSATKIGKVLLVGNSGSGKTGALASLAKAGYNLRIADFDAGADILVNLLSPFPEAMARVHVQTFTDKLKPTGAMILPDGVPTALNRALNQLNRWKDADADFGPVTTWGSQDVLAIDSLTFAGLAAMRLVLAMNGRSGQHPWQSDWGQAMEMLENLLALLYSDAIKCNVVVTSHLTFQEEESSLGKASMAFPSALGKKLPPKVGRYFNTVIMAETKGSGSSAKKILRTQSVGVIELKTSAPGRVPPELPLETGLATLFEILKGATPTKALT